MIFIRFMFNITGVAMALAAGFLADIFEAVLFKFHPDLLESYGRLPGMVAYGVFMIVLDISYRLTLGKRSKGFEGLENTNGLLLFRHCGGHFSYMPVWIVGVLTIVGTLHKTFGSNPDVSARQSNPYAQASVSQKSSYPAAFAYSPEPSYRSLKLGMISVGSNRIATVNGQPFAQGESHLLTIDSTKRVVRCTEIREQSVVLSISGDSQARELKIGEPLVLNRR
jgi:hypothetical protein